MALVKHVVRTALAIAGLLKPAQRIRKRWQLRARRIEFVKAFGKEYGCITNYLHIDGWLTTREAIELYRLTAKIKTVSPVAVEIGSWQGKSSLIIGTGLKNHTHLPSLYCIDPFDAEGDDHSVDLYRSQARSLQDHEGRSLHDKFIDNMKQNGIMDIVTVLRGLSYDFSKTFAKPIDLLFIDGNHEYEAVLRDYREWSPQICSGGILAFHDVEFDPQGEPSGKEELLGPAMVVKECIISNSAWVDCQRVDGLFFCRKV